MVINLNSPPTKESDYPGLTGVWKSYLTGERPIDDVLGDADFQRLGLKMVTRIVRGADRGPDIFQLCCAQFLRHDTEGPPADPNADRARSLRAANLCTLDQFLSYFYRSAQHLDSSLWGKEKRRQELRPTYDITAADLARARAEGVSSEDRLRLIECLDAVGSLEDKYRLTFLYSMLGYTTREIAQIMGCAHVTVINRLRVAMRRALGREALPIRKAS